MEEIQPLPVTPVSDHLGSLGIVAWCTVSGAVLGVLGALVALEVATGNARGGEMLFIGFVILAGGGIGFVSGLVFAFRWLRFRRRRRHDPSA